MLEIWSFSCSGRCLVIMLLESTPSYANQALTISLWSMRCGGVFGRLLIFAHCCRRGLWETGGWRRAGLVHGPQRRQDWSLPRQLRAGRLNRRWPQLAGRPRRRVVQDDWSSKATIRLRRLMILSGIPHVQSPMQGPALSAPLCQRCCSTDNEPFIALTWGK